MNLELYFRHPHSYIHSAAMRPRHFILFPLAPTSLLHRAFARCRAAHYLRFRPPGGNIVGSTWAAWRPPLGSRPHLGSTGSGRRQRLGARNAQSYWFPQAQVPIVFLVRVGGRNKGTSSPSSGGPLSIVRGHPLVYDLS